MSVKPHPTLRCAAVIADHENGVVQFTYFASRIGFFFFWPDGARSLAFTFRVISLAGRDASATVLREAVSRYFNSIWKWIFSVARGTLESTTAALPFVLLLLAFRFLGCLIKAVLFRMRLGHLALLFPCPAKTSAFSSSVKTLGFNHPGIRKSAGILDGEPFLSLSIAWLIELLAFSLSFFLSGLVWGVSVTRSEWVRFGAVGVLGRSVPLLSRGI
ncbi:hypothetical protein B0H14DRAFT_1509614 [Mycena olivaceomarginata]|nr:hypothetical protein B0H14DRAFT_1509614 [Mycena olivaceomarginata]